MCNIITSLTNHFQVEEKEEVVTTQDCIKSKRLFTLILVIGVTFLQVNALYTNATANSNFTNLRVKEILKKDCIKGECNEKGG